jgi:hypothetical protein
MKIARTVSVTLGTFVVLPIWYWLLYQMLVRVNATELMFFLFWVYVPVGMLVQILVKITDNWHIDQELARRGIK